MQRLNEVIAGEQGGVSQSVKWKSGGDFIYCELMEYNEVFMERIQSGEYSEELFDILDEMSSESFLNWYIKPEFPEEAADYFITIDDIDKQKQLLAELLDKNQLYVQLSEIEDEKFEVSESDKVLNKDFYGGDDDA
jgi:adenine-specific DNA-methyltransferase